MFTTRMHGRYVVPSLPFHMSALGDQEAFARLLVLAEEELDTSRPMAHRALWRLFRERGLFVRWRAGLSPAVAARPEHRLHTVFVRRLGGRASHDSPFVRGPKQGTCVLRRAMAPPAPAPAGTNLVGPPTPPAPTAPVVPALPAPGLDAPPPLEDLGNMAKEVPAVAPCVPPTPPASAVPGLPAPGPDARPPLEHLANILMEITGLICHGRPVRDGAPGWAGGMWAWGWCRRYAQGYAATHIPGVAPRVAALRLAVCAALPALGLGPAQLRRAEDVAALAPRAFFSRLLESPEHTDSHDGSLSVGVFCANMPGSHVAFEVNGHQHMLGMAAQVVVWDGRRDPHRTRVVHGPLPPNYAWYGVALVM